MSLFQGLLWKRSRATCSKWLYALEVAYSELHVRIGNVSSPLLISRRTKCNHRCYSVQTILSQRWYKVIMPVSSMVDPTSHLDNSLKWSFVDSIFWCGGCGLLYLFVALELHVLWLVMKAYFIYSFSKFLECWGTEVWYYKSGTLLTKCSERVATTTILHFIIQVKRSCSRTSFQLRMELKKDRNKAEMKERKITRHLQKYIADVG